ncbi:MAG: radical SAM protein [Candidatus Cloacimonetes bacterium]|nr:radical SAM protein [Candidatus Cloacimonadota bacterium]
MSHRNLIYPIFLPMQGCPHRCIYCDQRKISATISLDVEAELPKVARFIANHPDDDKQIAFYGGSFTALSPEFRLHIFTSFGNLLDANSSFRISTHPLYIDADILAECRANRVSCLELGIQDFDSEVLKESKRGYDCQAAVKACHLVKEHGFTLGVQLMPGLPGSSTSSITTNMQLLRELKPDYLRLYPLIVISGTPLAETFKAGEYTPLKLDEAVSICADYALLANEVGITIIKQGIPSNLPPHEVLGGPFHPAFGEFVMAELLVRRIILASTQKREIILDKKQQALLLAHRGKYKAILEQRLADCL